MSVMNASIWYAKNKKEIRQAELMFGCIRLFFFMLSNLPKQHMNGRYEKSGQIVLIKERNR